MARGEGGEIRADRRGLCRHRHETVGGAPPRKMLPVGLVGAERVGRGGGEPSEGQSDRLWGRPWVWGRRRDGERLGLSRFLNRATAKPLKRAPPSSQVHETAALFVRLSAYDRATRWQKNGLWRQQRVNGTDFPRSARSGPHGRCHARPWCDHSPTSRRAGGRLDPTRPEISIECNAALSADPMVSSAQRNACLAQ